MAMGGMPRLGLRFVLCVCLGLSSVAVAVPPAPQAGTAGVPTLLLQLDEPAE